MNEKIEMVKEITAQRIEDREAEQREALENIRDLAERMLKDLENGCRLYEVNSMKSYTERLIVASTRMEALQANMKMLEFLQK